MLKASSKIMRNRRRALQRRNLWFFIQGQEENHGDLLHCPSCAELELQEDRRRREEASGEDLEEPA
jgi:hypothetical protein